MKFKYRLTKQEFLYLSALTLYVGVTLFQSTYLYNVLVSQNEMILLLMKILRYTSYFLCIFKIAISIPDNLKKILTAFALILLIILITIKGTDKAVLFYFLIIAGAKDMDFGKIIKVFLIMQIIILIFCFLCYWGGIGSEIIFQDGRKRTFLGFGWVNRASYLWLGIVIEFACLKKRKLKLPCAFFFLCMAVYIYMKTQTRFSFIITVGVLGIFLLPNLLIKKTKYSIYHKPKLYEILAIPIFAITSILLYTIYNPDNPFLSLLNRLLNSRLSLGLSALQKYDLGLMGNKTIWTGASTLMWGFSGNNTYEYVDCGYLQLALDYGILLVLIVVFIYILGIIKACKLNCPEIKNAILIFGVLSIFEPRLIDFTINPFILYGISTLGSPTLKQSVSYIENGS